MTGVSTSVPSVNTLGGSKSSIPDKVTLLESPRLDGARDCKFCGDVLGEVPEEDGTAVRYSQ